LTAPLERPLINPRYSEKNGILGGIIANNAHATENFTIKTLIYEKFQKSLSYKYDFDILKV